MDLIDKMFFTAALTTIISLYLIKFTEQAPGWVEDFEAVLFLVSISAFVVFAFVKIWA